MNPVAQFVYLAAALSALTGLALVLFPGLAQRLSDTQRQNPYRLRPDPPEALRLKSKGAHRAMGFGLLLVAGLLAYYANSIR